MEPRKPLVSFVLTYYDIPLPMLHECIESIRSLSLTRQEREIIVVDDGSEHSPSDTLLRYGNEVEYIRQDHGGLSRARNRGIEAASGLYIQFADTDDYLLKTPYDHCLRLLRKHEEADMLMFDLTDRTSPQRLRMEQTRLLSGAELMSRQNLHASACGYLFRREILGDIRFTPDIYHEDEEFTPQLLIRAGHVIVTHAQAYHYRRRSGSITTSVSDEKTRKRIDDHHGVLLRLNRLAENLTQEKRTAMERRVAQLTMDHIYQIIVQTRSPQELDTCIETLRTEGLFPLPHRGYTAKYEWFRRLTNHAWGRAILLRILPWMKRER